MSILGAVLLAAAGLMGGLSAARALREELRCCGELCRMLSLMEFELERFRTPLPELFESLGGELTGRVGELCLGAARALRTGEEPFCDIWQSVVAGLCEPEREILMPLGGVLGRYDTPEQLAAAERAHRSMDIRREALSAAVREKSRVYIGVGTAAGVMLAVLLI